MKASSVKWPVPLEKDVQRAVIDFFKSLGFQIRGTSQYRRSGMAVGLPDLIGFHLVEPITLWFECKRPKKVTGSGRPYSPHDPLTWQPEDLRPDQFREAERLLRAGHHYGYGGILEAHALAQTLELGTSNGRGLFTRSAKGQNLALRATQRLALETFKPSSTT